MGTVLAPVVITPGNACPLCFGVDLPYELPTPKFIQMQLFDFVPGAAWQPEYEEELSSAMTLEQQGAFPCEWAALGERFGWLLIYHDGWTEFNVALSPLGIVVAFRAHPGERCLKYAGNELAEPPNRITLGGYAQITFGAPEE